MAETLITELAGVPVCELCDRDERPRCCFEVTASDGTEQTKTGSADELMHGCEGLSFLKPLFQPVERA